MNTTRAIFASDGLDSSIWTFESLQESIQA
jgi:hypothetical protein